MSIASVECMAAVVRLRCPTPPILAAFTGGCLRSISATSENGPRGRLVKLLCVFVILALDQGDPAGFLDAAWNLLPELQALCIEVDLSVDKCAGRIALFYLNNVGSSADESPSCCFVQFSRLKEASLLYSRLTAHGEN